MGRKRKTVINNGIFYSGLSKFNAQKEAAADKAMKMITKKRGRETNRELDILIIIMSFMFHISNFKLILVLERTNRNFQTLKEKNGKSGENSNELMYRNRVQWLEFAMLTHCQVYLSVFWRFYCKTISNTQKTGRIPNVRYHTTKMQCTKACKILV